MIKDLLTPIQFVVIVLLGILVYFKDQELTKLKLEAANKETSKQTNINDNRKFQDKVIDKTKSIDVDSRRKLLLRILEERDSK